jgi:two-component system sensor histidine kinase/response regulator
MSSRQSWKKYLAPNIHHHHLLLINNILEYRQSERRQLQVWGVTVTEADNVSTALDEFSQQASWELVIIDGKFSTEETHKFCAKFHKKNANRKVPIILLTNSMPNDQYLPSIDGIDACFLKPLSTANLTSILNFRIADKQLSKNQIPSIEMSATSITPSKSTEPKPKILLAEDNAINQEVCEGMLKELDQALQDKYLKRISDIAHAIKGSAGQLHGYQLQASASTLEKAVDIEHVIAQRKDFVSHCHQLQQYFGDHRH